jgi:hypothetical protein
MDSSSGSLMFRMSHIFWHGGSLVMVSRVIEGVGSQGRQWQCGRLSIVLKNRQCKLRTTIKNYTHDYIIDQTPQSYPLPAARPACGDGLKKKITLHLSIHKCLLLRRRLSKGKFENCPHARPIQVTTDRRVVHTDGGTLWSHRHVIISQRIPVLHAE